MTFAELAEIVLLGAALEWGFPEWIWVVFLVMVTRRLFEFSREHRG